MIERRSAGGGRPRPGAPASRRRGRRLAIAAFLVSAAAGHFFFWYGARERALVPSAPLARLLDGEGGWDRAVWLAYPHQNAAAIDTALGSLDDYLDELARVAGVTSPEVPRFGPFRVPPAHELALAWSDGEKESGRPSEFVGVARVYRGIGLLARAAGKLADNPWLAGGDVTSGGRSLRVRWDGPYWIVESPGAAVRSSEVSAPGAVARTTPALVEVRLTQPVGPLEPGAYRLSRVEGELEIRGGEGAPGESAIGSADATPLRLDLPDLALWVARSDRGPIGGPGLFLLWEDRDESIPRVAVLERGGGRTFRLPGEKLLELVGKGEPRLRLGWVARGTDRKARSEALRIVPWLERNYPRASSARAWLAAAGRLEPRRAARLLDRLAEQMRKIPFLPPAELARVEAGGRLLRPLAECSALTFEVWRNPSSVRVRLCPQSVATSLDPAELESSSEEDDEIDEESRIR